ncbi:MAG: cell shape-determining protein MreB [Microscillaceae bacterium]|nr:cell shape-determining protein MreB [Microscillaceae bacterium]MDW8460760.1 cell shape-determining protein MreB [Cytophagales bacterium]
MKKLLYAFMLIAFVATIYACKKKDSGPKDEFTEIDPATGARIIQGEITKNVTLIATNKYILKGFVYVTDGATLTIPPGTIIFGDTDTKGTLIIEKGGKIDAQGTAQKPIVFTSPKRKGQRNYGDWGGIVICGKAPHNQQGSRQFEGGIRGSYGTFNEPNDNSGIMRYVRIEFAGVALTPASNSEINGLTLYGVGSGTVLEYIQVSFCGDDSFEWFGGTVNAKYLIAHRGFDDDFDTDHGFVGKVQFAVSLRDVNVADQSTSNGFECDNFDPGTPATGPNNGLPLTNATFSNVSIFASNVSPVSATTPSAGSGPYGRGMHLRRNSAMKIYNTLIVGYPEGLRLDGTATLANANAGTMDLRSIVLANMNTPVNGANGVTAVEAQNYFNAAGRNNEIVPHSNLSALKLNANSFNLANPNFIPASDSPLLDPARAFSLPNDGFFQTANFRGAFNNVNWTAGWANFDPQNTDY